MVRRAKLVNDIVELVPILQLFSTNLYKNVYEALLSDWLTFNELKERFGEGVEEALKILKHAGMLEVKWRMPSDPAGKPEKEYHVSYTHINASFYTSLKDLNKILEVVFMPEDEFEEIVNKIIDEKHIKQAKQSLNLEEPIKGVNIFKLTLPKIIFIFVLVGVSFLIVYFLFIKTSNINQNSININTTSETNQKQTKDSQPKNNATKEEKYYILYFAATPSFEEAKKIKEEYENISGEKFNILKVQNGKYYSVARLYKDKETGKKDLERLKKILKDNDAFLTGRMFSVEIVE
ncbi:MAG TPA: hypothetical protein EYP82_08220 [Hydrogenothermaceae bacterium]|nr:hypothetical protein [Hydrogenothermaceae bacterium]